MALSSWRRRRRTPPLPPATSSSSSPRGAAPPAPTSAATSPSPSPSSTPSTPSSTPARNVLAFWLLGLANNSPYTIALAAANELAAGAVGSIFFTAVFPALLLKLTTPFWFPRVHVNARAAAAALMALTAFPLLAAATKGIKEGGGEGSRGGGGGGGAAAASATSSRSVLASIALLSFQGGLGEASALAAAGSYPHPRVVLGAWSSGTGAAGPVGFSFLMLFHVFAKLSLRATMLLALFWPALWLVAHFVILRPPPPRGPDSEEEAAAAAAAAEGERAVLGAGGGAIELSPLSASSRPLSAAAASASAAAKREALDPEEATGLLTPRAAEAGEDDEERGEARAKKAEQGAAAAAAAAAEAAPALPSSSSVLPSPSSSSASPLWAATSLPKGFLATSAHVASLWPFAVPLFLVYFAGEGGQENRPLSPFFSSPPPSEKKKERKKERKKESKKEKTQLFFGWKIFLTPDENRIRLPGRGLVRTRGTRRRRARPVLQVRELALPGRRLPLSHLWRVAPPLAAAALAAPRRAGGVPGPVRRRGRQRRRLGRPRPAAAPLPAAPGSGPRGGPARGPGVRLDLLAARGVGPLRAAAAGLAGRGLRRRLRGHRSGGRSQRGRAGVPVPGGGDPRGGV